MLESAEAERAAKMELLAGLEAEVRRKDAILEESRAFVMQIEGYRRGMQIEKEGLQAWAVELGEWKDNLDLLDQGVTRRGSQMASVNAQMEAREMSLNERERTLESRAGREAPTRQGFVTQGGFDGEFVTPAGDIEFPGTTRYYT